MEVCYSWLLTIVNFLLLYSYLVALSPASLLASVTCMNNHVVFWGVF